MISIRCILILFLIFLLLILSVLVIPRMIQNTCKSKEGSICESYQVCDGAVLPVSDSNRCCLGQCKLPKNFDWRNRHGENWNTPVKNQGWFGSCQTFGKTGAQEARINIYFNQHLDIDLSEQYLLDCGNPSINGDYIPALPLGVFPFVDYYPQCAQSTECEDCILAGKSKFICPGAHYCAQEIHGIVDEACYPYKERADAFKCNQSSICADWGNRLWRVTGHKDYILRSENPFENYPDCLDIVIVDNTAQIKQALIEYGPLSSGYELWGHGMTIVGYIEPDKWIFKNSWGETFEDRGYVTLNISGFPLREYYAFIGEVIPPISSNYSINCVDRDKDRFCNWGILENKPSTCSSSCKPEKDWDDSNSSIKALDTY